MIFHDNGLLANDCHEISYLIFFQNLRKISQNLLSAAVVICALRVNPYHHMEKSNFLKKKYQHLNSYIQVNGPRVSILSYFKILLSSSLYLQLVCKVYI